MPFKGCGFKMLKILLRFAFTKADTRLRVKKE